MLWTQCLLFMELNVIEIINLWVNKKSIYKTTWMLGAGLLKLSLHIQQHVISCLHDVNRPWSFKNNADPDRLSGSASHDLSCFCTAVVFDVLFSL